MPNNADKRELIENLLIEFYDFNQARAGDRPFGKTHTALRIMEALNVEHTD